MDRDLLSHTPLVLAVAEHGGFAAAAKALDTSPSNVSHGVKAVENRLGQPLFLRTTRSVSLTEAGVSFVAASSRAMKEMEVAWESIQSEHSGATGHLRINAPRITIDWVLKPVLKTMAMRYPGVTVEVFFEDGISDIVSNRFDAGIRLGSMIAKDMIAVRLAPAFRTAIVGSSEYLREHGKPNSIKALERHNCIQYRMNSAGNIYQWELSQGRKTTSVLTQGSIVVNDMLHALSMASEGLGLCYTFEPLSRQCLHTKNLTEVLTKASITHDGLSLYYPTRASMAPKLRAFIDTCKGHLRL